MLSETKTDKVKMANTIQTSDDPELERALNFNTVDDADMVPQRESQTDSNEEYFNQWVSTLN